MKFVDDDDDLHSAAHGYIVDSLQHDKNVAKKFCHSALTYRLVQ